MRPRLLALGLLAGLLAPACTGPLPDLGDDDDSSGPADAGADLPSSVVFLSPSEHLVRASMTLRGVRPSLEELAEVEADPDAVERLVDRYLETPAFGATMRDLHAEALLTRGALRFSRSDAVRDVPTAELYGSLGEEPLRLIEHVIIGDRPYTEIVTADYTMANRTVATAYGLAYDDAGPEWQETRYTDGRPPAGVLQSTYFFMRHRSAGMNWQRGRANAISRALLCYDFLSRDVVLDTSIDLSDPKVVREAVVENPACASCHQTLDPMASFLWGYLLNPMSPLFEDRLRNYWAAGTYPDRVDQWMKTSGRPPALFGLAGEGLDDLGRLIAEDPRFSLCAAQRFHSFFAQVPLEQVPLEIAAHLQRVFIDSGYSAKALARAVVLSDHMRASHAAREEDAAGLVGVMKARPEQLSRMFFDLTGFRWTTVSDTEVLNGRVGRVDLLQDDLVGYRLLADGIDSVYVVQPAHTFNPTYSLVLRGIAAAAAGQVVETDFAEPDPAKRRLLRLVEPETTDEPAIRAQLADLFLRLHGERAATDSPPVDDAHAVWSATHARAGDPRHAWRTTLAALFQDFRIATY